MRVACRRRDDDGSATIWVLAAGLVVLVLGVGLLVRATAVTARHRVERAADLAALAAAGGIGIDPDPTTICQRAAHVATMNQTHLDACQVSVDDDGRSGIVNVRVDRVVVLGLVGTRRVQASARAARLPG